MSAFFLDSSALTKRYVTEQGSSWLTTLMNPSAGHSFLVAEITRVEVAAALAARQRAGTMTHTERDGLVTLLLHHFDQDYQLIAVTPGLTAHAVGLTQNYRLRGYDAVQLAAALAAAAIVPGLVFTAADTDLLAAARAEGLATDNPNDYP